METIDTIYSLAFQNARIAQGIEIEKDGDIAPAQYHTIGIVEMPLDKKIIVKKSKFVFDDGAKIVILNGADGDVNWHEWQLLGDKFDLWALV